MELHPSDPSGRTIEHQIILEQLCNSDLQTAQDYADLRKVLEADWTQCTATEENHRRWDNNVHRLTTTAYEIKRWLRASNASHSRAYANHGANGVRRLIAERLALLQGYQPASPALRFLESPVMLSRDELVSTGRQCPAPYMTEGFIEWEWQTPALSWTEFSAVDDHLPICYTCSTEFLIQRLGKTHDAVAQLGPKPVIDRIRATLSQCRAFVQHAGTDK